jgi:hypothetical protein
VRGDLWRRCSGEDNGELIGDVEVMRLVVTRTSESSKSGVMLDSGEVSPSAELEGSYDVYCYTEQMNGGTSLPLLGAQRSALFRSGLLHPQIRALKSACELHPDSSN